MPAHDWRVNISPSIGPSGHQRQVVRRQRREAREQHRILIDGRRNASTALLVAGPDNGEGFACRANPGWIRMLAGVFASRLDRQLAVRDSRPSPTG